MKSLMLILTGIMIAVILMTESHGLAAEASASIKC